MNRPVSERPRSTKRRHKSADTSAQIAKSARSLSKTPFRKGSVRDLVYLFLKEPRRLPAFVKYVEALGADPIDVIRAFRYRDLLDEGADGWLSIKK